MEYTEKELLMFEGNIETIRYHNTDNGYCVFDLAGQFGEGEDELVCTGYVAELHEGENVKVSGYFVVHPTYGKQFTVDAYEKTVPSTAKGIEKYLASGVIKGIGARLAKRIVEKFGANTLMVIEQFPEKLAGLRGITPEKAMEISAIFHEQAQLRESMMFLQNYGVSPAYAMKIYKKYRDNTIEVVKTNPYALADDIFGIGFKIADNIAYKVGIESDSPYRVQAGIKYALQEATASGHVFLPREILLQYASSLLGVPAALVENQLTTLQMERQVWQEKIDDTSCVYLTSFYYAESYVAKKLLTLCMHAPGQTSHVEEDIAELESANGIKLADCQKEAVLQSLMNGVLVITGGPGTGKTTTVNAIIHTLQREGLSVELAAPTGRAAKRMSEATGMEAKTIHRALGISFLNEDRRRQTFDKNEDEPIEADVIILDECSMIDISLMHGFLKAVAPGTRLILVGDVDQLPSVGPGNVLKDIIASGLVCVVRLTEVFRQAAESAIIMNAHRINRGEYPVLNDKEKDFFIVKRTVAADVVSAVIQLVVKRLPEYMECEVLNDIQVLTPMRKSPLGAVSLNKSLQMALNPPSQDKEEKEYRGLIFREGDKVMQIKNNYNLSWQTYDENHKLTGEGLGIFNGDCGTIRKIDNASEVVTVLFDDSKIVFYDYTLLDELELAYAVTIHKSQGSEYKVVVIPIHSGPPMLLSRNLLYTAVTRAKSLAVIVGIPEVLNRMVDNNREINRHTSLSYRMVKINGFFEEGE